MTCQRIGRYPIETMGFGTLSPASRILIPRPPQNSTTFIVRSSRPDRSRDRRRRWTQGGIQPTARERFLDPIQPNVTCQAIAGQPFTHATLVQFLHPVPHGPFRAEAHARGHLVTSDPVTSRIGTATLLVPDR